MKLVDNLRWLMRHDLPLWFTALIKGEMNMPKKTITDEQLQELLDDQTSLLTAYQDSVAAIADEVRGLADQVAALRADIAQPVDPQAIEQIHQGMTSVVHGLEQLTADAKGSGEPALDPATEGVPTDGAAIEAPQEGAPPELPTVPDPGTSDASAEIDAAAHPEGVPAATVSGTDGTPSNISQTNSSDLPSSPPLGDPTGESDASTTP